VKKKVMLSIRGVQNYMEQDPDVIELTTEGILEKLDNGWQILYQETELTGMAGVTTSFRLEPEKIVLTRTGKLNSQMVFQQGVVHESLYQLEFGALMLCVCANHISWNISEDGGSVDLCYSIEIEQNAAGTINYHLDIKSI